MNLRDIKKLENNHSRIQFNISKQDLEILSNLNNADSLIIKEADKGGAKVVMIRQDHCHEMQRQLDDKNFYLPVQYDPTSHLANIIQIVVNEAVLMGCIDESTARFLVNNFPRIPVFYTLPKIFTHYQKIFTHYQKFPAA